MTVRFTFFPPLSETEENKYLMKEKVGHCKTKLGGWQSFIEKKYRILKSNPSQSNSHTKIYSTLQLLLLLAQSCEVIYQIMIIGIGRMI